MSQKRMILLCAMLYDTILSQLPECLVLSKLTHYVLCHRNCGSDRLIYCLIKTGSIVIEGVCTTTDQM